MVNAAAQPCCSRTYSPPHSFVSASRWQGSRTVQRKDFHAVFTGGRVRLAQSKLQHPRPMPPASFGVNAQNRMQEPGLQTERRSDEQQQGSMEDEARKRQPGLQTERRSDVRRQHLDRMEDEARKLWAEVAAAREAEDKRERQQHELRRQRQRQAEQERLRQERAERLMYYKEWLANEKQYRREAEDERLRLIRQQRIEIERLRHWRADMERQRQRQRQVEIERSRHNAAQVTSTSAAERMAQYRLKWNVWVQDGLPSSQPIPLPAPSLFKRYLQSLYADTPAHSRKKVYRQLMLEWHPDKMSQKLIPVLSASQVAVLMPRFECMSKEINATFAGT